MPRYRVDDSDLQVRNVGSIVPILGLSIICLLQLQIENGGIVIAQVGSHKGKSR
jgi:hypothetical protein